MLSLDHALEIMRGIFKYSSGNRAFKFGYFWTTHLDLLHKLNLINKTNEVYHVFSRRQHNEKQDYLDVSVSSTISFSVRFTVSQLLLNSCRNQTKVQQAIRKSNLPKYLTIEYKKLTQF